MRDIASPDMRALEAEAYGQSGYFTSAQARAHHVSSELLSHHVGSGRLERIRRGLYRLRGYPSGERDEMREKWMAVGSEKAVLCHESALALLGLSDNIPTAVHLLVPRRHRGLRKPEGVILHTRVDEAAPPIVWREGLPLTAPARTLVDVIGALQPDQAELAVRQALQRGLATAAQIRDEARRQRKVQIVDLVLSAAGVE